MVAQQSWIIRQTDSAIDAKFMDENLVTYKAMPGPAVLRAKCSSINQMSYAMFRETYSFILVQYFKRSDT